MLTKTYIKKVLSKDISDSRKVMQLQIRALKEIAGSNNQKLCLEAIKTLLTK